MTTHLVWCNGGGVFAMPASHISGEAFLYAIGDVPPRYPMPAILTDHALHMRYPRVLSEGDKANADDYFWRLYHRLYGKK